MQYTFLSPGSILTAIIEIRKQLAKQKLDRDIFESFYFNKLANKKPEPKNIYKFRRNLKLLQRQGYIKLFNHHNKMEILLAQKGRLEDIKASFNRAPKYNNGRYLVAAFDIPHKDKTVRDQFRQFLKENNFKLLQKSVWIIDRQLYDQLLQFIKEYDIEQWVDLFETDKFKIRSNRA